MNWQVRHEGSPQVIDNLSPEQVVEGLADARWDPTDEVKGPDEPDWAPIENHPLFAEAAAEVEPPPPPAHDDETRLDFNPLIDVCLVLLVLFILTTTYAALEARIEAPGVTRDKKDNVKVVKVEEAKQQMIFVTAKMEGGQPVIRVEDEVVSPNRLVRTLLSYVKASRKTTMLFQHDDDVPQEVVVRILDAARGAGVTGVNLAVP
jgi:biopolymer transport protein ExbD